MKVFMKLFLNLVVVLSIITSLASCSLAPTKGTNEENTKDLKEVEKKDDAEDEGEKLSKDEQKKDEGGSSKSDSEGSKDKVDAKKDKVDAKHEEEPAIKQEYLPSLSAKYTLKKTEGEKQTEYRISYFRLNKSERYEIISEQKRWFILYNEDDNRTYTWTDESVGRIEKGRIIDFYYLPRWLNKNGLADEIQKKYPNANADEMKIETKEYIDSVHGISEVYAVFAKDMFLPKTAVLKLDGLRLDYDIVEQGALDKESQFFEKPELMQFESETYSHFSMDADLNGMALIEEFSKLERKREVEFHSKLSLMHSEKLNSYELAYRFPAPNNFDLSIKNKSQYYSFKGYNKGHNKEVKGGEYAFLFNYIPDKKSEFYKSGSKESIIRLYVDSLYMDVEKSLAEQLLEKNVKLISSELLIYRGEECVLLERLIDDKLLGKVLYRAYYSVNKLYPISKEFEKNGRLIMESELQDIKFYKTN